MDTPNPLPTTAALVLAIALFGSTTPACADDEEPTEPGIHLHDRLLLTTSLEFQWNRETINLPDEDERVQQRYANGSVDLGLQAQLTEAISAEANFAYDFEDSSGKIDTLFASWETEIAEVSFGLQEIPFALTETLFISDPLTDFGTLDGRSLIVAAEPFERSELNLALYEGTASRFGSSRSSPDWALEARFAPTESLLFSLSYLSDLADSDREFVEDFDNLYERRVSAMAASASWGFSDWKLSLEAITALGRFHELEAGTNKPSAWNTELAWFINDDVDLAIRLERSKQLSDEPEQRLGVSANWNFHPNATASFEWLRGKYASDFAFDDDDNPLSHINTITAQLKIEF